MLLIALFMPLQEVFDRWDMPGLTNDTEFAVFALAVTMCLVLLVSKLIASGVLKVAMILIRAMLPAETQSHLEAGPRFVFLIPPLLLVPLRV
jgi:hypothetical protein